MTPLPAGSATLCVALLALIPLAPAGLALLNAGLGRSRSAAHSLLGSLCLASVAAIAYFAFGFSLEGYSGGPGFSAVLGQTTWDWVGSAPLFFRGIPEPALPFAAFQIFAVAIVAVIPWGSGADRWRLAPACAATVVLAGVVYPIFAHGVWARGWLAQLGANFRLGSGFVDPGGAATLHAIGGLAALALVWILGPRRGKFPRNAPPAVIPAHHIAYVLFGGAIALPGWLALNLTGALLFTAGGAAALALTAVNTLLCACAALLASLAVTRLRFGKPDASLCANAWIGGLVASSAVAAVVSPGPALFTGIVAGAALPFVVELLELRCALDDPSGGIAVHGFSALWGLLAAGFFLRNALAGQVVAQGVGIATLLGLVLPVLCVLFWLLNRVTRFRTRPEGERIGMDLHELGSGAYPEFALHSDEFLQR